MLFMQSAAGAAAAAVVISTDIISYTFAVRLSDAEEKADTAAESIAAHIIVPSTLSG